MILSNTDTLFSGIENKDALMERLGCYKESYKKGGIIIEKGESVRSFGEVMEGAVSIIRYDYEGHGTLVSNAYETELFAESFSFTSTASPVTISAKTDCSIIWFPIENVKKENRLLINILTILANRNLYLTKRIEHLSQRTIKEKVLSYLKDECKKQGSASIKINLDRQEMADFLATDRSALSLVLMKMQREGLIEYSRNNFKLLNFKED